MDTKTFVAEVPQELADRVEELADMLDQPAEWVLKQALTEWVDREEYRHQLTLEGLADVEAGRVVDHEAVMAWAESLATDNPLPMPMPKT